MSSVKMLPVALMGLLLMAVATVAQAQETTPCDEAAGRGKAGERTADRTPAGGGTAFDKALRADEAARTDRARNFEAIRLKRLDLLGCIDEKSRESRSLDKEVAELRDKINQMPQPALVGRIATSGTQDPEPPTADRFDIEINRLTEEQNLHTRRLESRRSLLQSQKSADIDNDGVVVELNKRLIDLKAQIAELSARAKTVESERAARRKVIEEFTKVQAERQKQYEREREDLQKTIERKTSQNSRIQQDIVALTAQLDRVNAVALRLIEESDGATSFRTQTSMIFSALVGLVIVGFFYIVRSDARVVFSIFSNDSGIQFITLFSIVIAVILFGIIGVLEGKELSALLGGLSGYILGRTSADMRRPILTGPVNPAPPSPQAAPAAASPLNAA